MMSIYRNVFSMDNETVSGLINVIEKTREVNNEILVEKAVEFNDADHPGIINELATLRAALDKMSSPHKAEIVISFFKDHSIKTEWVKRNPELIKLIVSGTYKTNALETLFEKVKNKQNFLNDFEQYIKKQIEGF